MVRQAEDDDWQATESDDAQDTVERGEGFEGEENDDEEVRRRKGESGRSSHPQVHEVQEDIVLPQFKDQVNYRVGEVAAKNLFTLRRGPAPAGSRRVSKDDGPEYKDQVRSVARPAQQEQQLVGSGRVRDEELLNPPLQQQDQRPGVVPVYRESPITIEHNLDEHSQDDTDGQRANTSSEDVYLPNAFLVQSVVAAEAVPMEEKVPLVRRCCLAVAGILALVALIVGLNVGLANNRGDRPLENGTKSPIALDENGTKSPIAPDENGTETPIAPTWTLRAALNGSQINDRFGGAVDVSSDGQVVAIGAPFSSYHNKTGYVEVYALEANGEWNLRGERIVGPPETNNRYFGQYVRLSGDGDYLLIYSEPLLQYYEYTTLGTWELKRAVIPFTGTGTIRNMDLSQSGQYAAVLSSTPDFYAHLQVFDVTQETLPERGNFDPFNSRQLGRDYHHLIAISGQGEILAIGGDGFALVYRFGYDRWRKPFNFTGRDDSTGLLGSHVSVSEDGRVVAIGDIAAAGYSGKVHFIEYDDNLGDWLSEKRISVTGGPGEMWGKTSMSLSGDGSTVAVISFDDTRRTSASLRVLHYYEANNGWDKIDSVGFNDSSVNPIKCAISYSGTTVVCGSDDLMWDGKIGRAWIFELA